MERGLEEYFAESEAYDSVRSGAKRIVKKGEASRIYRYIRDHHANDSASKLSALVSYLKRMEGLKIGKYEASVKTRELEKLYKLEEIHHLLPGLREIANQRRIIVLVDELDRGWDSAEDAQAFLAGLFQACLSVNSLARGGRPASRSSACIRPAGSTSLPPSISRCIPCSGPTWVRNTPATERDGRPETIVM